MLMSLHTFAAAAAEQEAAQRGAMGLVSILPWVIVLIALYFIMIRPQRKKEKEAMLMRSNIQIGDEILTIGGIVGIVVRKGEDTVVIETGGDRSQIGAENNLDRLNLRIRIEAVQENITAQEEAAKEKKEKANARLTPGAPKKENSKKDRDHSEE